MGLYVDSLLALASGGYGSTKVFDILAELFNPRYIYLLPTLLQIVEIQMQNLLKSCVLSFFFF